jgi:hypothetical protein
MTRKTKPISNKEEQRNALKISNNDAMSMLEEHRAARKRIIELDKDLVILRKAKAERDALKAKAVSEAVKPVEVVKPISNKEEQRNALRISNNDAMSMLEEHRRDVQEIIELDKRFAERQKARAEREAKAVSEAVKPVEVVKPKTTKRKKQLEELESLHKEIKQTKIPNLSSLKRKHQLVEMEMLKKEIEHSKITYIKIDSCIEGMIIKLDALTKSKVLRKQVRPWIN